jgi:ParB family chromosome partitioning protein
VPELKQIPIADLQPDPNQPRKEFDEAKILALAENIKAIGVQVPLIVVAIDEERPREDKQ